MARQSARARLAAKKMRDKWKSKEWYKLLAPEMFNSVSLGETPADDPSKVIGRRAEVTLNDVTGDFSKMHIKMKFEVYDINGFNARTKFVEQSLTSDYVRRMVRRKRSKIDSVFKVTTKEGYVLRMKPMAVTDRRIQNSQKRMLRALMVEETTAFAKTHTLSEMLRAVVSADLQKRIARKGKKIYPLKKVEFRKIEVLREPSEKDLERLREEAAEAAKKEREAAAGEKEEGKAGEEGEAKEEEVAPSRDEKPEEETKGGEEEVDLEAAVKDLTRIPGVGPQKAKILAEAGFTSVESIKSSGPEALEVVDGIGAATAKKIYEAAKTMI
ncbi:MAG: 30S ribosomal protein S3ae [Thermoplasmata archaeon]|nr:30S ribosomal protein S3ae [Thermoplasmata archaeon]